MSDLCIKALVSGRVQGVFFRQSTRQQAHQLGLSGHAVNLPDGRVEVVACGDSGQIDKLVGWLHTGPPQASVIGVAVEEIPPRQFTTFSTG